MKQLLSCFAGLIFFPAIVFAQPSHSSHASQVHLVILGPGSLFSINFDSRITKKENGIGFNFGLGHTPLDVLGESCNNLALFTIPVGLNYLVGKNQHLLELGAGAVPVLLGAGTKVLCLPAPGVKEDFFSDKIGSYWYMLAGYRYQPVRKKGLTYRLFISPLLQKDFPLKFWGGASIGYRF